MRREGGHKGARSRTGRRSLHHTPARTAAHATPCLQPYWHLHTSYTRLDAATVPLHDSGGPARWHNAPIKAMYKRSRGLTRQHPQGGLHALILSLQARLHARKGRGAIPALADSLPCLRANLNLKRMCATKSQRGIPQRLTSMSSITAPFSRVTKAASTYAASEGGGGGQGRRHTQTLRRCPIAPLTQQIK